jgi:phosphatidylglycerol:prolipoprotein diacylglycerol transferase
VRRVLFTWRGVRVWSYPALVYLGLVAGLAAQNAAAHAAGLDAARVYAATLLLLPLALAGARALHVAQHWDEYRRAPRRIWRRAEGGMAMLGGVPIMLAASAPLLAWLGVPYWRFWDSAIFCILTGMVFARVGCLLNGCCAGRATDGPLGVRLPDQHGAWARRVPVQPMEAAVGALLLAAVAVARPRLDEPGALFLLAAAMYGAARLALQRLRADRPRVAGLDPQLAIAAALAVGSLAALTTMVR